MRAWLSTWFLNCWQNRVQAKGVSLSFDEQLDAVESLYGQRIHFTFTAKRVREILEVEPYYSDQAKQRVERILLEQMRKYPYLFDSSTSSDCPSVPM